MQATGLRVARVVALVVPLALLGGALGSQYIGKLIPCEMCIWQRWPHLAAIVLALLAYAVRVRPVQILLVALAGLAIAASGAIGVFHAGVEYHWWPGITACTASFNGGGGDILAQVLKAPRVRCDQAQWELLGISLAGFNALFSLAGALAVFGALLWRPRA